MAAAMAALQTRPGSSWRPARRPLPSCRRPLQVAAASLSNSQPAPSTTASTATSQPAAPNSVKKKVLVVGGGWAGYGALKHLAEQGYDVTLLDASPNPGGLSAGWRTPQGRAVEAGTKGFWWQYHVSAGDLQQCSSPPLGRPLFPHACTQVHAVPTIQLPANLLLAPHLPRLYHSPAHPHSIPSRTSSKWSGSWACPGPSQTLRPAGSGARAAS